MNAPVSLFAGIRAAIIDLDGTMMDTAPDFLVAINGMRTELMLEPVDIAVITNFVGKGTENLVRSILGLDYTPAQVGERYEQALEAYMRHYSAINGKHSTLYAGVAEGLHHMQEQGLRLACVTNKPIAFALPLLEAAGLLPAFEVVYGGDSLPRKKPDPMPLLQVCADFSLAPHRVVAIGDSSNDALAARAAGCRVLNVPYGYNHGQPIHEVDSDGIVDTLLDAARLISAANPYQHVSQ
ncbi:MAG: phosphoglycolate phosphatase [Noviherbaspirillum sp.]